MPWQPASTNAQAAYCDWVSLIMMSPRGDGVKNIQRRFLAADNSPILRPIAVPTSVEFR